ncbi:Binding-protein-dependent transport systems inner membrane component [Kibdelosporangium sp. 4NS15]|uniref:Binding-protein-dependent transport systems inner membrane component n=1 Tax=Kibdelosporangium persicum TaxID=2698649 RepID=A0ABX2F0G8_9PSEU|nr:ABC transporter permease [Kibdelosporangium persicum]NRN64442.1 Binding-protein-dependent transport systems inner membrane component [Kibdelosporangium persicum]
MKVVLPVIGLALVIGLWWLATIVFGIERFLVPSPKDVVDAYLAQQGFLIEQAGVTLLETVQGFLLAVVAGVPIALLIVSSKILERMIYPLLLAVNAVPKIAIAPILVVWLGFGMLPKVVMVLLVCFFPIVISTASGMRSTPAELVELLRSLDCTRWQEFFKLRLRYAMPQVFVGMKVAISLAVIGAVIAEFVGANAGLGYVIVVSGGTADTALAFAAMALLAVLSIVLFYGLVMLERFLLPWAEGTRN